MLNKYKMLKSIITIILCSIIVVTSVFNYTATANAGELTSVNSAISDENILAATKKFDEKNTVSNSDDEKNYDIKTTTEMAAKKDAAAATAKNVGQEITQENSTESNAVTLISKSTENENFTSIAEALNKIDEYTCIESENNNVDNLIADTYTIRFSVSTYELTANDVKAIETARKATIIYDGLYKEQNATTLDLNILGDEGIFFANDTVIQNIKLIYDKNNAENIDSDSAAAKSDGSANTESNSTVKNGNTNNSVTDSSNVTDMKYLVLAANGYKLTIGQNVETPDNTKVYSGFAGLEGKDLEESDKTSLGTQSELIINSGTYESVIAGGSKEQESSKIIIQGGTINNIYGSENANLNMTSILVRGGVYRR